MNAVRFVAALHLRRRWASLVGFGLVAGLVGALVLGCVAGARRSATVYDRLARATDAPDALVFLLQDPEQVGPAIRALPQVAQWSDIGLVVGRGDPTKNWYSIFAPTNAAAFAHVQVARGRKPDPAEPDEVLITQGTADIQGIDVGDTIPFHAYTRQQMEEINAAQWDEPGGPELDVRVVGIVRDVSDAASGQTQRVVFGTPALAATLGRDAFPVAIVQLRDGTTFRDFVADALTAARRASGLTGVPFDADDFDDERSAAHKNESVVGLSLGLVAVAMAVAGSIVLAQAGRRHFTRDVASVDTLATLGLTRTDRTLALALGFLPHLLIAVPVAVGGAYLLSAVFPVGNLRSLEPDPGLRGDPLVLGVGVVLLGLVGAALTILVAARASARPDSAQAALRSSRFSALALANTSPPVAVGVGFALRPARAGSALPLRSAQVGTVVAIALAVGAIVFAAGTSRLLQGTARFGLDYDVSIELATGTADATLTQLAADKQLAAVAELWEGSIDIDGRLVTSYAVEPAKGSIRPVLTDGQLPYGATDIALGPALLDDLHLTIGDTVSIGGQELRIVGAALAPGIESDAYAGSAVLVPQELKALSSDEFPSAIVSIASGFDRDHVLADLDARYPYGVLDESLPEAPAALRKLSDVRSIPIMLAVFFVLLGAAALVHSLIVATRSHRRELSVLRSLGFTPRQNGGAICAMASVTAALAVVAGVPLGLLIGGRVWRAVVDSLSLSDFVVYPLVAVSAIALGAVVLANVVALVPARMAAVQSPAEGLHVE